MTEHQAEEIQAMLPTAIFGKHVSYSKSVGSTNIVLKALAEQSAPEGTLALTEEQTAGRGRFSRRWVAPPSSSLLMSLLFRPTFLPPTCAQWLTMVCALAATDAIHAVMGISVGLKWPNDLVYGGKKLAGILTELSVAGDTLEWVIVGMGLNVNVNFTNLSDADGKSLAETATSLQAIAGKPISRAALLKTYLLQVEARYFALKEGISPVDEWREQLTTLGQLVAVQTPQKQISGRAEGISPEGALLIRTETGTLETVLAGDVSLRG